MVLGEFTGADVDRSVRMFEMKVNEAVKANYSEMVQTINNSVRSAIQSFELSLRINVEDLKCNLLEGIKKARRNDNKPSPGGSMSALKNNRPIKSEPSNQGSLMEKFMNRAKDIKRQRKGYVEEVDLEEENNPIAVEEVRISRRKERDTSNDDIIKKWATKESVDENEEKGSKNSKKPKAPVIKREPGSSEPIIFELSNGWKKQIRERQSGASMGRVDVIIISPMGKRFRSKVELTKYAADHPNECEGLDLDQVRFSRS